MYVNNQKQDIVRKAECIKLLMKESPKKVLWSQTLPKFFLNCDRIESIKNVDKNYYAKHLNYFKCELQYDNQPPWKCMIADDKFNSSVKYVKPIFVYNNWQFNYFFGFGINHIAYNKNRIVKIIFKT
jgi:hypothetical protein